MRKFGTRDVEKKFMSFPDDRREYLLALREMIFDVAETDSRIGHLSEELRWGDPSYITATTNAGSTVRLGLFDTSKVALFFNCNTTLVESFRNQYSDTLEYSKNRAILIDPRSPPKGEILQSCIYSSLVYKLKPLETR